MDFWREFHGPNAGFVLELYDRYHRNPDSVDAATRAFFTDFTPPGDASPTSAHPALDKIVGTVRLAQGIRAHGHRAARLDPLGPEPPGDPALDPITHGVTEEDLRQLPAHLVGGPVAERAVTALEAIQALRRVYSGTTGYGYAHIQAPEERAWLRQAAEAGRFRPPGDPINPRALLDRLTQVECFERFLHRTFPGKTRFSLEGLDMLVPILDEVIAEAAEARFRNILLGMAHRGRLNVLAHVLKKPYGQILAEFKDPARGWNFTLREDLNWTGDVKYHLGAYRAIDGGAPVEMVLTLPPNPSHVEAVNPVVEGMARAAGTRVDEPGPPHFDPKMSLPILIHGDAAFPGQGVMAETLNLSRLPGYHTGGTIHIIANNQLGYTTEPAQGRSTLYASDLAKGFEIPIVHVNADDPEACLEAARLVIAYLTTFHKDFLIDLVGYRRHGHNEGDEPAFTQPLMYAMIARHPTVRERWATVLQERGLIDAAWPRALVKKCMAELEGILSSLQLERELAEPPPTAPPPGAARRVKTAVPADRLRALHEAVLQIPPGFALHPKLAKAMERRRPALAHLDEPTIDWPTAEVLAFGSILEDGVAIRLTGQDVARGTFSQRHAVFHDVKSGQAFIPLQALPQAKAAFEVHDSPLSENAALGFEYGYNIQAPGRLVIWEAQYGDFVNGAQVMIDEFITSARAKWGQTPSLVLLLPHGFEGQGPDHSSARPERFLNLAAETNLRLANPTTAAQYFHLLRRQAALLTTDPLPLVVLTPKSLLRHPRALSSLRDLAEGYWQPVLNDPKARSEPGAVRRMILCSGKVHVDLVTSPPPETGAAVALVRLEQLYPFPAEEVAALLPTYPSLQGVVWLQEEPENMGAWAFVQPRLARLIRGRWPLHYIGRPPNSSPAEGSPAWHASNQNALVEHAYNFDSRLIEDTIISMEAT
jgi:2-oxoglutarate dehydrogenase E1 component